MERKPCVQCGYCQVPVKSSDVSKTVFTTPYGNYEFKVMPLGLCGAASTFQYLMDIVFAKDVTIQDQLPKFADFIASYLDDTFIFSDTLEEHLIHITVSLNWLRQFGLLYVKTSKCKWLQTSILFLGHQITSQGLMADPHRLSALQSWPVPTNRSEPRSLLRTFGYWRTSIKKKLCCDCILYDFVDL
jgi:hypothetical protein